MPVSPILPGRLPETTRSTRLLSLIGEQQAELQRLNEAAATGVRYVLPSDNPGDTSNAILFQGLIEQNAYRREGTVTDSAYLAVTETALAGVGDLINETKSIILEGVGANTSPEQKNALATEVDALLQQALNFANTSYKGRYLFGGSEADTAPFTSLGGGRVRYDGDAAAIDSNIDSGLRFANNIDGATAFNATTTPVSTDINPALTSATKLEDLFAGTGVTPDAVTVTLDDGGGTTETVTVDLSSARTIGDVETQLEAAFAGALTLDVGINATNDGLLLTATGTATTVAVSDPAGSLTARALGIESAAAAAITGGDVDPALTTATPLTALNGNAGATFTDGLLITSGVNSVVVDLSGATTLEGVINAIESQAELAGLAVDARIADSGDRLEVVSRISGEGFSIAENGGDDAASLGILTFTGTTPLDELNGGTGVPVDGGPLTITRRDGTATEVDLSAATTVQDVLDAINAADPGVLTARLNTTGNGITLADTGGTGDLVVATDPLADALGLTGTTPRITGVTELATLNGGSGVPAGSVAVTRTDGSNVNVDLTTATTVQDVLDAINAVDPGVLTATINADGTGIDLADTSGGGSLTVAAGATATALGIDGTDSPGRAVTALVGADVGERETGGIFDLLGRLSTALRAGDDAELARLDVNIEAEQNRFLSVRNDVAARLNVVRQVEQRLLDDEVALRESLSEAYDADITEVVTRVNDLSASLQATLQITANTLQLSLINFI